MDRILTTHVGSLIRPQALLDFLAAMERGESYRRGRLRAGARRRGRRRRAAPGRGGDRRDRRRRDGQGELDHVPLRARERPRAADGAARGRDHAAPEPRPPGVPGVLRASTTRSSPARWRTCSGWPSATGRRRRPTRWRPRASTGSARGRSSTTAPRSQRDIARLKAALAGVDVADASSRWSRPRASYWLRNEYYATEEEFVFALADALHEEYKGDRRRGLPAPGRRRGADARVRLDPLARRLGRGLPPLGRAARRRARPRARGDSRRTGSATTSASGAGTARTSSTRRSPT